MNAASQEDSLLTIHQQQRCRGNKTAKDNSKSTGLGISSFEINWEGSIQLTVPINAVPQEIKEAADKPRRGDSLLTARKSPEIN